ncbi:MAG: hypothetical protein WD716_10030 [Fimbriimonadaceae bacterium]
MKTRSLLPLLLLVGCAAPEKVTVEPPAQDVKELDSVVFLSGVPPDQDLALLHGDSRLYLGVTRSEALGIFEPQERSTPFSNLPEGFADNFTASGWERGTFSFGCIGYTQEDRLNGARTLDDVVVLAMVTREDVDADTVAEALRVYSANFGPPDEDTTGRLQGQGLDYWFWTVPGRRLMISATVDPKGKRSLTIALGVPTLMTHLRMSPDLAVEDRQAAIESLAAAKDA